MNELHAEIDEHLVVMFVVRQDWFPYQIRQTRAELQFGEDLTYGGVSRNTLMLYTISLFEELKLKKKNKGYC